MENTLAALVGRRIKVWQTGSEHYYFTEEGTLEGYDHPWLCLRDDTDQRLYLPIYSIRLMRAVGAAEESSPGVSTT